MITICIEQGKVVWVDIDGAAQAYQIHDHDKDQQKWVVRKL